jgi:hypothetical protein
VWYTEMKLFIIGPFFFMEATVVAGIYLDMLEQFMYPQLVDLQLNIIYVPTGWGSPTLEFACSRNTHENLPRSLDWAGQTNLLAPAFAGYHSAGFLFLGVCQGPSVCYLCAWPSNITRPLPWCDCLTNPGHVGQNKARNWVQTWHYSCHQWVTCWRVLN